MRLGFVILVRYNSRRLPGKALTDIQGRPMLWHVYNALENIAAPEQIVVATSAEPTDDPIASFCRENDLRCFRGDLEDVADRFFQCAIEHHFTYAARINGDNLFVSLETIRQMQKKISEKTAPDFMSNVKGRTFPYGMSVEIVRTKFYEEMLPEIQKEKRFQEHVTLYLYENEDKGTRQYFYNTRCAEAGGLPFAIDTTEDLAFARKMAARMDRPIYSYNLASLYQIYLKIKNNA